MTAEAVKSSALKPNSKTIGRDLLAGLIAAIAAIPDGMASAVLAGVNPVLGLYNLMVGTPVAALFSSSVYMAVINTSAMALVVNSALAGYTDVDQQTSALVVLTILVGAFQLLLGVLKLGYLTRFISNSVMTGFLTGIAVIIILGQLGDFTGYSAEGNNKVAQTIDLLLNLDQVDLYTLAAGMLTLVLIVVLDRTRLSPVALQVVLYVYKAAERMEIAELVPTESGDFLEGPAPDVLPDWQVTMLVPHGSLFYAGAADFEEEAPSADDVQGAVVVLILRGRKEFGSTALNVFKRYAEDLREGNGRLVLAIVNEGIIEQLERTGSFETFGSENVLLQDPLLFASTTAAYEAGAGALASLLEERDRAAAVGQEEVTDQME